MTDSGFWPRAMKLSLLAAFAFTAWSQPPGQLTGKLMDMSGQRVANAEIRLKKADAIVQRAVTSQDGSFMFEGLPEGSYSIEIQADGKVQTSPKTLEVSGSSPITFDLTFTDQVSSASARVGTDTIRGSSSTIQAESAEVSRAYVTRTVRSLPLIDRQNQELISLMPGVTPPVLSEDRILDPQRTREFNVNGLPSSANAYFQDGSYQNENFSGRQSRIAPNTSVQQLDVRTSNYNAEHGLGGGGVINTVTRPGTNTVHGSLFGLHTNRFLTTRNPVNFSTNDPGFNVNQLGGSAGGPVVSNKTFWFAGYEAYLRRGSVLQINTVPTAGLRSGDFSQAMNTTIYDPLSGLAGGLGRQPFPGNRIPSSSLNPLAQRILLELPLPNQSGLANNLVGAAMLREDQHRMDGKVDQRFSEKSTGFLRYGFTHGGVDRGSQLGALGNGSEASMRNHNASGSLTQSFSTTLAAEFRAGYSRYRNAITPTSSQSTLAPDLARLGLTSIPDISIPAFGTYGPGNYPTKPVNNTFSGNTNWNWHNGMHHLKFGAQAVAIRADGFDVGAFSPRGSFAFGPGATLAPGATGFNLPLNTFAGFLLGAPSTAGISSFQETPTYRQTLTSGYVTDTLNLWKNVHLELGVRYDVFSPLRTRSSTGATVFDPIRNQTSLSDGSGNYDLNNIAPRIGIVVRPIERMAVRAGYGIHYFPVPFSLTGINQTALAAQAGIPGGYGSTTFAVPSGATAQNLNQEYNTTQADSQTPYVQSFNLMVQSDLGNGILLDLGYVGNLGRQLPYRRALNVASPGSGVLNMPYSRLGRTAGLNAFGTGLNSNYNALQVNLTKRFAAGLALAGAYTFGKVLDTGFDQVDPFNTRNNYGPADWDRSHILAMSHLWQLPFGPGSAHFTSGWPAQLLGSWQLNGIIRWVTGSPYSITGDPLNCNCPGVSAVRAVAPNGLAINGQSSFDAALFSLPAAGSFGSATRNGFRGPDFFTYDASVFRRFPFRENFSFELRAEAYNVTNTTNLANPTSFLSSLGAGTSTRTVNGAFGRQFQLGLRLLF